jgi:hypothetical protein
VLAGLGIGASLSILHSGAAVIPALFAAHWLRDRSRERHAWLGLSAAIGLAGLIAYLAYPSGATGFETHSNGTELFDLSGHAVVLDRFRGGGFVNFARATWDFEPWLALLAGAGCVLFVMQRRRAQPAGAPNAREKLIVLAAWCVPYFVVCGLYDFSYERFLVQLLPCAALAAAYACSRLSRAAWPAHSTIAAALIGVLALASQAFFAVRLARAWGEPDTLTRCARWLREEVPPGSARLAVFHTIDLPLLRYAGSLHENWRQRFDAARPWIVYQDRLAPDALLGERYDLVTVPFGGARGLERFDLDPAASIASWNADYVIVETGRAERMHSSEALLEQLRSTAVRVARFSPYSDPKETAPFDFQQVASTQGWWTERLCKAVGSGPVVEVYRLH